MYDCTPNQNLIPGVAAAVRVRYLREYCTVPRYRSLHLDRCSVPPFSLDSCMQRSAHAAQWHGAVASYKKKSFSIFLLFIWKSQVIDYI